MATDEVISHEDRTLQRVMQESLNESYTDVPVEEPRMEELVRLDGRCVYYTAQVPVPSPQYPQRDQARGSPRFRPLLDICLASYPRVVFRTSGNDLLSLSFLFLF
jgi:hypothetical protein